jgi:hypothetical protein
VDKARRSAARLGKENVMLVIPATPVHVLRYPHPAFLLTVEADTGFRQK